MTKAKKSFLFKLSTKLLTISVDKL